MKKITCLDEKARPIEEVSEYKGAFDVADYTSKMFNMFTGETSKVVITCDLSIREEIMDRFGAKIPLTAVDTDHFKTEINAAVSDGLVSWIMSFGNKIKVEEPKSLAKSVKEKAQSIAKLY
jgi:predicted DNA-binding transcriptional regulator YafY